LPENKKYKVDDIITIRQRGGEANVASPSDGQPKSIVEVSDDFPEFTNGGRVLLFLRPGKIGAINNDTWELTHQGYGKFNEMPDGSFRRVFPNAASTNRNLEVRLPEVLSAISKDNYMPND
jgi:hypothetical protein